MEKFQKEFEIHYYEVNFYQELTPLAFLNYLEETAIAHSEAVGYGVSRLKNMGYGWVLSHWQIHFEQYPKLGEIIKIQTWPSHFERFYGEREFLVLNAQDKIIARASSLWIFLNLAKRRPTRIPSEISEAYRIFTEKGVTEPFPEFNPVQIDQMEQVEFIVRRSDIDTNDHVNNTKYIEWVLETVPEEVYRNYRMVSLEVAYKKESTYGEKVLAVIQEIESKDQTSCYRHHITDAGAGQDLALAQTSWLRFK